MATYGIATLLCDFVGKSETEVSVVKGQRVHCNVSTGPKGWPVIVSQDGWTAVETITNGGAIAVPKKVGYVPSSYLSLLRLDVIGKEPPKFQKDQRVFHKKKQIYGIIEKVHDEIDGEPYYTVALENGNAMQATENNLVAS